MSLKTTHEWELAAMMRDALRKEDYAKCQRIQNEVNERIADGSIDLELVSCCVYLNGDPTQPRPEYAAENGMYDACIPLLSQPTPAQP